jgi:hypothetical protein
MPENNADFEQRGRIFVRGAQAGKYWARCLCIEEEVDLARELMNRDQRAKRGMVPVVAEYQINDSFKWIYFISIEIDMLGIIDATGIVYYATREYWDEVLDIRDELANKLFESAQRDWDKVIQLPVKKEL